ncbi:MAG TPA: hemolysin family protein [Terrimesophilobacter sp.]|nr:hemolysin family protein [Terrimesophilobacter sp.]
MLIAVFIAAAVLLVALGGWLAAAESATGVLSRQDVLDLAAKSRAKRSLLAIADETGEHINAASFVRVVVETTAAVLITLAFMSVFEEWWWVLLCSAALMTLVSFVLVGASPRAIGRVRARGVLRYSAGLVHTLRVVLGPVVAALVAMGERVTPGRPRSSSFSSEEQLLSMVDEATEHAILEQEDRELIHSIFEFNDTVVREVMVPRTDMVVIDANESIGAAMALFLGQGVSRIPVIGDDVDTVLGVIYLRDVARLSYERPLDSEKTTVAELARQALFVPESKKADDMLGQMQLESNHLAMVVDEYGGIAGLVTMEDLIEELVGDISDEYDRTLKDVVELGEGRFRVSGRLPVDELGDLFGIELDDDEVDSAGGLLTKVFGRLPEEGSTATHSGLVLTADRVERRRGRIITIVVSRDDTLDGLTEGDAPTDAVDRESE